MGGDGSDFDETDDEAPPGFTPGAPAVPPPVYNPDRAQSYGFARAVDSPVKFERAGAAAAGAPAAAPPAPGIDPELAAALRTPEEDAAYRAEAGTEAIAMAKHAVTIGQDPTAILTDAQKRGLLPPGTTVPRRSYGYGPPPDFTSPFAGQSLADLETPGEFANRLYAMVLSGDLNPDEAKKRIEKYRNAWGSAEGIGTQMAASQVEGQQAQGISALGELAAQSQNLDDRALLQQRARERMAEADALQKQADEEHRAELERQHRSMQDLAGELEGFKLDRTRAWSKNENRVAGVFAGLAMVAGILGDAFDRAGPFERAGYLPAQKHGGHFDRALGMLTGIVDRDIEDQKLEREALREGLGERKNLYAMTRARFADEGAATEATRARMLADLEQEARIMSTQADSERLRRGYAATADQLARAAREADLRFQGAQQAAAEQARQRYLQAAAAAANAGKADAERAKQLRQLGPDAVIMTEGSPEMLDRWSPVLGGYVTNKELAKDSIKQTVALNNVLNDLNDLEAIIAQNGSSWSKEARARAEALWANIAPKTAVAFGQGAMSEGDRDNIERMFPVNDFDPFGTNVPRIQQTRATLQRQALAIAATSGVIPGTAPVADEHGKIWVGLTPTPGLVLEDKNGKKVERRYVTNAPRGIGDATRAVVATPGAGSGGGQ